MTTKRVLFDVDGTVSDGQVNREGGEGEARPGIQDILDILHALGFNIDLWSSCGADHAAYVGQYLQLDHIDGCYGKDAYPWPASAVALVVDDDPALITVIAPTGVPTLKVRHAYEILHPGSSFEARP